MRVLVAIALLASTRVASAELPWTVDVGVRGAGSIAVGDDPMQRSGAVPSMTIRAQRSLGAAFIGANLAAGFRVYVGQHEASLSVGVAHELRSGRCVRVDFARDVDADPECDASIELLGGIDAGVGILHYDAPPELSSSSNAVLYWGPLARARVALRAMWPMPTGKQLGFTIGAGVATVSARYTSTATGTGVRLEPELDIAGVIGF